MHSHDWDRIPKSLTKLEWRRMDADTTLGDGETLLVARPVEDCPQYLIDLIYLAYNEDDDAFDVIDCQGELIGLDLAEDVDYFVVIE